MEQLALIIKVQATIRGYLTRKKIRVAQMNMGIYQYDPNAEVADDYDNPKVQVSPPPNPTISLQLPFLTESLRDLWPSLFIFGDLLSVKSRFDTREEVLEKMAEFRAGRTIEQRMQPNAIRNLI